MDYSFSIKEIRQILPDAAFQGSESVTITGVAAPEDALPTDATFVSGKHAQDSLTATNAGLVFIPDKGLETAVPHDGQALMMTRDPSLAMAKLCEKIQEKLYVKPEPGLHPSAWIHSDAHVGEGASIGPGCFVGAGSNIGEGTILEHGVHVGDNVKIGADCCIMANVVIRDRCVVGDRVRIHSGTVVGADGFGYVQVGNLPDVVHYKVPQIGIVVIEDDVEIGANCAIDRARLGETRIGQGSKLDNLVQIGHNVRIGRRCILCAQVGIAGSTTIGDYVVLWGQAGTVGHIKIGNFAFVGAQAGVAKSLPDGAKVTGTPARPLSDTLRADAALLKLPSIMAELRKIRASGASTKA